MKSTFLGLIAASVLALSAQVSAAPILSGDVQSEDSYAKIEYYTLANLSTDGEKIESISWDLSSVNMFFDTVNVLPGVFKYPLVTKDRFLTGHHFPLSTDIDGKSVLTISFDHFDAGEVFTFGVDTDFFGLNEQENRVFGADFIGSLLTVNFSDDTTLWGKFEETNRDGKGAEVTAIPEPGSLAILGLGLVGFAFSRRQKRK
ncbi:MAG: PEP-CTERM sorting domain-containing protein [Aliivibrio sp.]|uniref:PEP-CTERM sorting domain-containing protein n=1 Tax=Aliivibrio sp. TaxID=1872443 RepID=UPI001A5019C5|nr:PEP-CTERM sorting domain-containing protein [Aliivibrio sp.]